MKKVYIVTIRDNGGYRIIHSVYATERLAQEKADELEAYSGKDPLIEEMELNEK